MISVIVPTLNEEKYLENTLESIKRQDYEGGIEIIVSDGSSTDKTVKIARKHRCKVVVTDRKGPSAGRNAGARKAKGEIFVFIDSDTKISPNALREVGKALENKAVTGVSIMIEPSNRDIHNKFLNYFLRFSNNTLNFSVLPGFFIACRRESFENVGGFDESLRIGEDTDFSLKLGKLGHCRILNSASLTTSNRRVEKWGVLYFGLRYHGGYFANKYLKMKPTYDPIR